MKKILFPLGLLLSLFVGCATKPEAVTTATPPQDVWVLCRFDLKPGADRAEYVRRTAAVEKQVRAEKGCLFYTLLADADSGMPNQMKFGENVFFMLEHWTSVDALKAHLEQPHMKAFGPTVRPMREKSTFHVLKDVTP